MRRIVAQQAAGDDTDINFDDIPRLPNGYTGMFGLAAIPGR